ncbi:hypothetical protein ACFWN1_20170 [Streptomyces sp. NPDC058459]|uniref:hypothetical protein n=1 Tax=Streptomyces sp. NPDC058459 TaxID=3346508 RepID=UPI00364DE1CD
MALGVSAVCGGAALSWPGDELRRAAEGAARSDAEFFFPDAPPTLTDSRRTELGGRPAHTVALDVPHDGGTARVELTAVAGAHGEFLLALTAGAGDAAPLAAVHAVHAVHAVEAGVLLG